MALTYLITHVARTSGKQIPGRSGSNPAQLRVTARSEVQALDWFLENYPQRMATAIGIEGEENAELDYVTPYDAA